MKTDTKKILIIEDDELIADIYKRHFESAGFEVCVEKNGAEGYYRIFRFHPDAVLLDLLLPGMDGPTIIRKFRAQKGFTTLPILVFTNAYLGDMGRDAVSAGATLVFNKATTTPQQIVAAANDLFSGKIKAPVASPPQAESAPREENPALSLFAESSFSSGDATKPDAVAPDAPAPKPPQPDAPPADELENQIAFQTAARGGFLGKVANRIDAMRDIVRQFKLNAGGAPKAETFLELSHLAHTISGGAAIVALDYLARLAAALEAFARELSECPAQFGVPQRYTLAKTIDMIARLATCGPSCQVKEFSRFHVLVVDDDEFSRTLMGRAFDWANLSHVATGRSETALELLRENKFDLVILDVNMDGLSGFEICAALRKMDHLLNCPVIFVTVLSDFHSKMVSLQTGGKDFIVKPFAPMELALKSILYMIGAQLGPEALSDASPPEPGMK
ncbi:MAG: response regulator [Verrucomicrobiota bacterium]